MNFNHNFILSLKNNRDMTWLITSTELIDNAVDAAATEITLVWQGHHFLVLDNGQGVSPAGFEALYTLGGHRKAPQAQTIGRYGIGFKESAGWLWGVTTIKSRHDGVTRQLTIDWDREAKRGAVLAETAPVKKLPTDPARPAHYTEVRCEGIDPRPPVPGTFQRMVSQLAHIYRPALTGGLTLRLHRAKETTAVQAMPWPERAPQTPEVDTTIRVRGRTCQVRAYVAAEDQLFPGIHLASHGRAMDVFQPVESRRIYGWVWLGPEWTVGKNKTQITDAMRPQLMRAIERACAPVIKAARTQHEAVVLRDLVLEIGPHLDRISAICLKPIKKPYEAPPPAPVPDLIEGDEAEQEGSEPPATPKPRAKREVDDPEHHDQADQRAPKIGLNFGPSKTGEALWLEISGNAWTVMMDSQHALRDHVKDKVLGLRERPDASRTVNFILQTIAAASVTSDVVAAAMPWLADVPPPERFGQALQKLWTTYLTDPHPEELVEPRFEWTGSAA